MRSAGRSHRIEAARRGTDHDHVHPLLVSMAAAGAGEDGSYDEAVHHSKHGCRRLQGTANVAQGVTLAKSTLSPRSSKGTANTCRLGAT